LSTDRIAIKKLFSTKFSLETGKDAAYIPPGCDMIGKQAGKWMWRSPEAHARGPINKPSDIFSFALVVSSISRNSF
jgi:hypothetical protein